MKNLTVLKVTVITAVAFVVFGLVTILVVYCNKPQPIHYFKITRAEGPAVVIDGMNIKAINGGCVIVERLDYDGVWVTSGLVCGGINSVVDGWR